MMRLTVLLILTSFSGSIFADWKLAAIYNESDLQLEGAYRLVNKGKGLKKASTFIDKRIKTANKSKPVIIIDYKVPSRVRSQGYLCIYGKDKDNKTYELLFDSYPKYAIAWNRSKTKDIALDRSSLDLSSKMLSDASDGSLWARVVLKQQDGDNVLARAGFAYEDEQKGVVFDLFIRTTNGVYSLELSPYV